ncbi:uncharacterized protein Z518_01990 [Rhinocladiella mackenziei CBS 650.93]|uniref:Uncharacterized protein n=1 Tax=Rhinocladiella mackenziei CBS 650.93 TaxID=1442369 RepID=A0A0D2FYE5_9EURO|nr:uncharacterized protein Z518_01990 [Rhinocladiella mackenziei CBS 650.93]KIX07337.1 hypothetical protein Z518_01990 [Rhinocladiella mackenziei CBS 650.93]
MVPLLGDKTYYNRSVPTELQPTQPKNQRLLRVLRIWQVRQHKGYFPGVLRTYLRLLQVLLKPVISLAMLFYSINVPSSIIRGLPESVGGYGMRPVSLEYTFLTPIVAVNISEAFGHWSHDNIVDRQVRRHQRLFVPEVCLYTTYIGGFLIVPRTYYHRPGVASPPQPCCNCSSGEISAWINFGYGFSAGYFQQQWGAARGYDVSFGLQAVVVVYAFVLLASIQRFGAALRAKASAVRPLTT